MKLLLVGSTGTLGSAVYQELENQHDIITAARNHADISVDITSPESIREMYLKVGKLDAVISTAGATYFGHITELTPEGNELSIQSKLKGQVNLVLLGINYLKDGGSFTLTTGVIMDRPIVGGVSSAMASGAIKSFVESAALEMPRGIRINHVSPNVLVESMAKYGPYFPGFTPVPANLVAKTYRQSLEGNETGQTYRLY
jgi:NAD(P)-dependent dehydrogenase (short-subunit alcohol dehydrogenase family)